MTLHRPADLRTCGPADLRTCGPADPHTDNVGTYFGATKNLRSMAWARSMYGEVFDRTLNGENPIVSANVYRDAMMHSAQAYLLRLARDWNLDPERRAVLAYILTTRYRVVTKEDVQALGPFMMELHDELPGEDLLTYIYYITLQRLLLFHRTVRFEDFNVIIFNECLQDVLEIDRKTRVNKTNDTQMYIALNCLYSAWSDGECEHPFQLNILHAWMRALLESSTSYATMRAFLHRVDPRCAREAPHFRIQVREFRWRNPRKRKRETTTVIGDCGICFDEGVAVERTHCGHDFCAGCLRSWSKQTCPTCRRTLRTLRTLKT